MAAVTLVAYLVIGVTQPLFIADPTGAFGSLVAGSQQANFQPEPSETPAFNIPPSTSSDLYADNAAPPPGSAEAPHSETFGPPDLDSSPSAPRESAPPTRQPNGWLGVSIQPVDADVANSLGLDNPHGALVTGVVPDGPAARAGILQGDVVLTLNGVAISDSRDLTLRIGAMTPGQRISVDVVRDGVGRLTSVLLGERPPAQTLASANQPPNATPNDPGAQGGGVAQAALEVSTRAITADDRTRFGLTANETGVVITNLEPSSGLAEDGVLPGDIILQAGGRAVRTPQDLNTAVEAARSANRPLLLQLVGRAGRRFVAADLTAR